MSAKLVFHEQRKVIDFTSEKEAYNYYLKIAENEKYEVLNYQQYKNNNENKRIYSLDICYRTRERYLLK